MNGIEAALEKSLHACAKSIKWVWSRSQVETRSLVLGKMMAEDSLGLVLLQRRSFFDNRLSISRSEFFINQSFVLQFLWRTPCGIGPKLIKSRPSNRNRPRLVAASKQGWDYATTIRINTVFSTHCSILCHHINFWGSAHGSWLNDCTPGYPPPPQLQYSLAMTACIWAGRVLHTS